jgi:squalene-hopene/tetraprenyl-beta-curcumene cyclase
MMDNVTRRVRLWRDVEPFYPDQKHGLPKTSESRGTEAVLNALILATRDADTGVLSVDGQRAFANVWALQMQTGDLQGAWSWLNFGLEPWEASASPFFGAALAAIAVGTASEGYASTESAAPKVELLRAYVQKEVESQSLFNRLMALWASGKLPGLLSQAQREAIVTAASAAQSADGGWSMPSLAPWGRIGDSILSGTSDGFATALTLLAMQQAGGPHTAHSMTSLEKGRAWLIANQDSRTGSWPASSINKESDPNSDRGKFMSDAATAYAARFLAGGG